MRASNEPHLVNNFYQELGVAYEYERRSTDIVMIAGDFNAKLGNRENGEELILGKYGIGTRNQNGDELVEFLADGRNCIQPIYYSDCSCHE